MEKLVLEIVYGNGLITAIEINEEKYKSEKAMYKAINTFIKALSSNQYLLNVRDYFNLNDPSLLFFVSTTGIKSVALYTKEMYDGLNKKFEPPVFDFSPLFGSKETKKEVTKNANRKKTAKGK